MSQKSATVALISFNSLLLLKRGNTAPWNPDRYCLPGGKLESDESLIKCAARELYEETGIRLDTSDLSPLTINYPKYSKTIFVCNKEEVYSVKLNWEHSNFLWAKCNDAQCIPMVPGLNTTIKTLVDSGYLM